MLQLIEAEMRVAMSLTGVWSIGKINETILARN
jgi:isopentenyl diphosphate isomerase/L-lactate dehydrogenase-like FMN-dependent dehydrogenase